MIKKVTEQHVPVFDLDNDTFSDFPTLRGFDWKGRDCNDLDSSVYPGRNIPGKNTYRGADYNCNGISGVQLFSRKTWKEVLCGGTGE